MRPGGYGWLSLVGFVTIVDAWLIRHGHATLSTVFGDALDHPIQRLPVILIWGLLTIHLFSRIIERVAPRAHKLLSKYDPISRIAHLMEKK